MLPDALVWDQPIAWRRVDLGPAEPIRAEAVAVALIHHQGIDDRIATSMPVRGSRRRIAGSGTRRGMRTPQVLSQRWRG